MLLFSLLGMGAAIMGAGLALLRRPGRKTTSYFQHIAAGVVFAAAAGSILPQLLEQRTTLPIVIGGGLGIALTYVIKWIHCWSHGPSSFLISVSFDTLIDGLVIGVSFVAGAAQGMLLTGALSLELLFLGIALTATLAGHLRASRIFAIAIGIGALIPVGATLGYTLGRALPEPIMVGFYAFGLMALLYLVTEELLVEGDRNLETPGTTAAFFAGFLAIVLVEHHVALEEAAENVHPPAASRAVPHATDRPSHP